MAGKQIKDTIHAKGIDISIYTNDFQNEFISITDIARYKNDDPSAVIQNWMRNRDVIEFLGLWESLHNPDFKPLEFEGFRNQAGANAFTMMESYNAVLIEEGISMSDRLKKLRDLAIRQMKTLNEISVDNLPNIEKKEND